MKIPKYPLEQLASIKKKRLEEAEKVLKEKREILESEKKHLKKLEEDRDQVKAHKADKIQQMNEKYDQGIHSDEIERIKIYLKVVDEKLMAKEDLVKAQTEKVKQAEKAVEEAKENVLKKQQEVEKLEIHRSEWKKEVKMMIQREEGKEMDELGSAGYAKKQREEKH